MNGFLLNTNILAELRKPRPDANVVRFVAAQTEDGLFVSDVTFAEIRFRIEQLADPRSAGADRDVARSRAASLVRGPDAGDR